MTFFGGFKESWPLMVGYLPVAVAFGVSAQSLEISSSIILLISVLIFAGASQFAFIALFAAGTPILTTILITIGLNLRHLLYSSNLSPKLENAPLKQRLIVAFGLTDEVFATAFHKLKDIPAKKRWLWILGLEFGAYASWVIGTFIGVQGSDFLLTNVEEVRPVLNFALPALFFSLLLPLLNKKTIVVVAISFVTTLAFTLTGHSTIGIFVAAFLSPILYLFISSKIHNNNKVVNALEDHRDKASAH